MSLQVPMSDCGLFVWNYFIWGEKGGDHTITAHNDALVLRGYLIPGHFNCSSD